MNMKDMGKTYNTPTYNTLKRFVAKPIIYCGLALMLIGGCKSPERRMKEENEIARKPTVETTVEVNQFYFERWGIIDKLYGMPQIKFGDFDSDGDLDVIATDRRGFIKIYENRIPQKK